MNSLLITMTWDHGIAIGLAFIAVGAFGQYWVGLELDDRRDIKAQETEADRDAIVDAIAPRIPAQRDGGAS